MDSDMEPLERRYYGNEPYRQRERERRTRHPGPDRGYQIGPMPGGGDIALRSGPHVGRGPRDYRRSDARILEDVCDRLADDSRVDASEVVVQVRDADVTLEGSVRDRRAGRLAEDIAAGVPGVRDVFIRLRVGERRSA
jgi:BON domain-containing protein